MTREQWESTSKFRISDNKSISRNHGSKDKKKSEGEGFYEEIVHEELGKKDFETYGTIDEPIYGACPNRVREIPAHSQFFMDSKTVNVKRIGMLSTKKSILKHLQLPIHTSQDFLLINPIPSVKEKLAIISKDRQSRVAHHFPATPTQFDSAKIHQSVKNQKLVSSQSNNNQNVVESGAAWNNGQEAFVYSQDPFSSNIQIRKKTSNTNKSTNLALEGINRTKQVHVGPSNKNRQIKLNDIETERVEDGNILERNTILKLHTHTTNTTNNRNSKGKINFGKESTTTTQNQDKLPQRPDFLNRPKSGSSKQLTNQVWNKKIISSNIKVKFNPQTKNNIHPKSGILSFFFGMVHFENNNPESPIKCLIGEGNNQKLVLSLLKERAQIEIEGFYSRSNYLWTQTQISKFVPLNLNKLNKYSFLCKLISPSSEIPQSLKDPTSNTIGNAEYLADALENAKLFTIRSKEQLTETFRGISGNGAFSDNKIVGVIERNSLVIANHIKGLKFICRKALLAKTITEHCERNDLNTEDYIPRTFLIRGDTIEEDLEKLCSAVSLENEQGFGPLIVKPGEFSNRGNGIAMVFDRIELKEAVSKLIEKRKSTSWVIVQQYINKPLLFKSRKFDIRCYALVTKLFHAVHFFWYKDGYARTSSFEFDPNIKDNLKVHLTNEAVQVKGSFY